MVCKREQAQKKKWERDGECGLSGSKPMRHTAGAVEKVERQQAAGRGRERSVLQPSASGGSLSIQSSQLTATAAFPQRSPVLFRPAQRLPSRLPHHSLLELCCADACHSPFPLCLDSLSSPVELARSLPLLLGAHVPARFSRSAALQLLPIWTRATSLPPPSAAAPTAISHVNCHSFRRYHH